MRKPAPFILASALLAAFPAWVAQAGTYTNNFDTPMDLLTNGVPGSGWDGAYLQGGDVPLGSGGGPGTGVTLAANVDVSFPLTGYLYVQSSIGGWSGSEDDGFFLYKLVSGDFDASLFIATSPYDNANFHFAGLLARAYTTNGPVWGAPFSTTSTNASENWLNITRFNEFNIGDQIRYATNATDIQISAPHNSGNADYSGIDTNNTRWVRIVRSGDVFSFYDKTNATDTWTLETNISRGDLHGISMQVGIEDAPFSASTVAPIDLFANFSITGPNVNVAPAPPVSPTGLAASVTGCSTVNYTWTPAPGSAGSVLVLRKGAPIIANPVYGIPYSANTNFGSGDALAANEYVVFAGAGGSATISGLLGSNNVYYAAVYSYSGSGSSINYSTNASTLSSAGPGTLSTVSFTLGPTNIPVGGAAIATVTATYCGGDSYDVSSDPSTLWGSSNPTTALATNGTVTGLAVGSSTISASYRGIAGTGSVTVTAPAFTDNFGTSLNFAANGLPGSAWDGLYVKQGDVPFGSVGTELTSVMDANITSNQGLTITAAGSAWEGGQDNGPFLFKYVPGGDFQTSVHISGYTHPAYQFVGIQARAYGAGGAPNGTGNAENHVNWWRFDQFGVTTSARSTVDSGTAVNDQTDGENTDMWLLMTRVNSTNFNFFKKQNATDPWTYVPSASFVRADLSNGVPLQVGLAQATYTANAGTVTFDNFMLDTVNIAGGIPPSPTLGLNMTYDPTGNSLTLIWVPGTNSDGSVSTSMVVMRAGAPVSAQPTFGILTSANSVFGLGTDLGSGNYVVFRGVGNTVTVTGLTPGTTYYAAVYGYSGSGSTKSFNEAGSSSASTTAGHITNVVASLSGSIPLGGAGFPKVTALFDSGGQVDISTIANAYSTNPSVVITTNNVVTGVGLGSTWVMVTAANYTNFVQVTVRAPSFTDNFSVSHNYLSGGVTGTSWDGVYNAPDAVPGNTYASDSSAAVFSADANTTSNNTLTVMSENVGWEFAQDDGFFLFKYVPADFQAAVHLFMDGYLASATQGAVNYNNPGLLARAYGYTTNGNIGAPFGGTNGTESWVSWTRFDQFGIGTYARLTLSNATTQVPQPAQGDTNMWLLIVRQNGTNFSFYQRAVPTDPWKPAPNGTTFSVPTLAGQPLQVGLLACGFNSGNIVQDQFDSFMLDLASSQLQVTPAGANVIVSWPSAGGGTLQSTTSLTLPNWQAVSGTPTVVNGVASLTVPRTGNAQFFRLVH